jgi:hypothetical protein
VVKHNQLSDALDDLYKDQPRLDIRSGRDRMFEIIGSALEEYVDFIWEQIEDNNTIIQELPHKISREINDKLFFAAGYGVDIYLAVRLAEDSKLHLPKLEKAQFDLLIEAIRDDIYEEQLSERHEIAYLITTVTSNIITGLIDDFPAMGEGKWKDVEEIRLVLEMLIRTGVLFTMIHWENLYPAKKAE